MTYSRAGRERHALEEVDSGQLVHDVVELLFPPPGFAVDIAPTLPRMRVERIFLENVFRNLIDNAIKHHPRPSEGHLKICFQDRGAFVGFAVQDNGLGIAPEYHQRIFALFQMLQPRDKVEGNGKGLTLAKKKVESRGGMIVVGSTVGEGASFRFTWPKVTDNL